jgi:DNA-directed RNA polymerase subunit beta
MAVSEQSVLLPERVSFARIADIRPMPGLIQIQLDSFEWFKVVPQTCRPSLRKWGL